MPLRNPASIDRVNCWGTVVFKSCESITDGCKFFTIIITIERIRRKILNLNHVGLAVTPQAQGESGELEVRVSPAWKEWPSRLSANLWLYELW